MFRALGDRTRLNNNWSLVGVERCVFELQERLKINQPSVSRHLRILRDAGLVCSRRSEKRVYYALGLDGILALRKFSMLLGAADAIREGE
jgi:ArsR family transcriptional regulator, arsenate/arsenite/antimonite-responsive transcriptional repressor